MPRDSATLLNVAVAARLVAEFTAGMDRAAFLGDLKTQDVPASA